MFDHCPICTQRSELYFQQTVLARHAVKYFYCDGCGLLRTEKPYWLEEAYVDAIADADTGLIQRNLTISRVLTCLLYFLIDRQGRYLDFAGGYGLLVRLMRDRGFDFYWSDKYCQNIFARGFERTADGRPFTAVTAFEVLEHVYDPLAFVNEALSLTDSKTLVFTTELYKGERPPAPKDWWYYAFGTGQHISFYCEKTLIVLAQRLGLRMFSHRGLHVLTRLDLNERAFRFVTGRLSHLLLPYIRRRFSSKTVADHEALMTMLSTSTGRK